MNIGPPYLSVVQNRYKVPFPGSLWDLYWAKWDIREAQMESPGGVGAPVLPAPARDERLPCTAEQCRGSYCTRGIELYYMYGYAM